MKSLNDMLENLETMTDSVRLRPLLWKFFITGGDVLTCVLINTSAPSHWLKVSRDQLALSLKFRDIPDWSSQALGQWLSHQHHYML